MIKIRCLQFTIFCSFKALFSLKKKSESYLAIFQNSIIFCKLPNLSQKCPLQDKGFKTGLKYVSKQKGFYEIESPT